MSDGAYGSMRINVVTPPTQMPVTLADCYGQLRLDPSGSPLTTPDDAMLNRLISSATDYAEIHTRRALCQQTLQLTFRKFPWDRLYFRSQETLWSEPHGYDIRPRHVRLIRPQLISFLSMKYYDQQNVLQTVDPSTYLIHSDTQEATIELLEGFFWPILYLREDAVQLNYIAGYPPKALGGSPPRFDYAFNVPAAVKQAILLHVQLHYDPADDKITNMWWQTIDALLDPKRSYNF